MCVLVAKLSRLSFYALASCILMWRGKYRRGSARMTAQLPCLTAGTVVQKPRAFVGLRRLCCC